VTKSTSQASRIFFDGLTEDIKTIGGVEGVATSTTAPLVGAITGSGFPIEDGQGGWINSGPMRVQRVSHDYFKVLRIPIVAGRSFDARDVEGAPCVAVVNRTQSKVLGGPTLALGRIVSANGQTDHRAKKCVIVGTVENARDWDLKEEAGPQIYLAYAQHGDRNRSVLIRTRQGLGIAPAVRARIKGNGFNQTVSSIVAIWEFEKGATRRERLLSYQIILFATCGCAAAALGLIALASYFASARRVEVGIRRALGSGLFPTILVVVRDNAFLVAIGVVVGTVSYHWIVTKYAAVIAPLQPAGVAPLILVALTTYLFFLAALAWPVGRMQRKGLAALLRAS